MDRRRNTFSSRSNAGAFYCACACAGVAVLALCAAPPTSAQESAQRQPPAAAAERGTPGDALTDTAAGPSPAAGPGTSGDALTDTAAGPSPAAAGPGTSGDALTDIAAEPSPAADDEPAAPALPQAKSVELDQPVSDLPPPVNTTDIDIQSAATHTIGQPADTPPLVLLGTQVPPLTATRLSWSPAQTFEGLASPTPVLVVHGAKPGPTLCLTAAIHGDELNGIEIVRRVLYEIKPAALNGSLIGVPVVNLQGFHRRSRYLPDRRDLNRYFPGTPNGSSAARTAHAFFHEVIDHCSVLVDIHTGSFDRTNLPQLRADLAHPFVLQLTQGFGGMVVLHNEGARGTLRRAAVEQGIPAVTLEAGGPMRLQEEAVRQSVKSINSLLDHLGMVRSPRIWGNPEPVYYSSRWLRADAGGILLSTVELGEAVARDEVLGSITNPITNVRTELRSPVAGRVLGMAQDQVVMPGYATYHIGISAEAGSATAVDSSAPADASPEELMEVDVGETSPDGADPDPGSQPVDELLEFD